MTSLIEQTGQVLRLARWGLALLRHDTRSPSPVPENPKFMSPRDAVRLIRDGAVVAASGLGAHQRASILYWAIRDAFADGGHPADITLVNVGGHGGRGILPGSIDELALPGLCARFITSHFETMHGVLKLAAAGQCELQCIPLGIIALLFDALQRGKSSVVTDTGVGTFLDPRVGRGSPVANGDAEQLVSVSGDRLRYRMPNIDVALFNLPAADRHGNLYATNAAMIGDSYEIARAARRNGGSVIANVGLLVEPDRDRVFLPAEMVDAVVHYPDTEQTLGFFHRDPWPALTAQGGGRLEEALDYTRFLRRVGEWAGALSRRTAVDEAVSRLAAATLRAHVPRGAEVAIGTGLPETVGGVLFDDGAGDDLTLLVESGMIGGLPASGAYFGAAFSPRAMVSTAQFFKRCYRKLDAACLGALEVDAAGNVNVSKRGPGVEHYVGPGGFIDFTTAAHTVVFVCGWMRQGEMEVADGAVRVTKHGSAKFVPRVGEITFNGPLAQRAGKQIFYATPVGLFRLTRRGLELASIFPGIDVRRDVLDVAPIGIALPPSGEPLVLARSIVTGVGFDPRGRYPGVARARQRAARRHRGR